MDHGNAKDKDTELDLESGLAVTEDNSKKDSSPGTAKQEKTLVTKVSGGFIGGSIKKEDRPSLYCNESNLSGVSIDVRNVINKSLVGQDSVNGAEKKPKKTLVKEEPKKPSNKKAPKPPRPPRGPILDAADQKLIRELTEFAMLKRARIERLKALKKMKASKSSSSSSIFVTVFTIAFFLVLIFQGMSSGKSSVSFQGSPLSTGEAEGALVSVHHFNLFASNPNPPGSESHNNFVQPVAGLDLPEKLRRDVG